ncbi:helicase-related protein [Amycolatopsis roodepoortensis]|uniref:helicase-related protein n=1 Tax=Amycolatopsis roodepoortensis TaxID=700274 RepID=UPI00214C84DF|nr:helicase-related protein [Amycolatopsis roodepoortensis]UUV29651.1 helicase-related protein [Amycolatopsis roodepoortensis]
MSGYNEHYRFRDALLDALRNDVLGPAGGESEVLSDPPGTAYVCGVLFPRQGTDLRPEEDQDFSPANREEDFPDTGVAMANLQAPSSMGLTFAVDATKAGSFGIRVEASVYDPIDRAGNPTEAKRAERGSTGTADVQWRRRPLPTFRESVKLSETAHDRKFEVAPGLECRVRLREPRDGVVAATVTLVNTKRIEGNSLRDQHCFCQPLIEIEGPVVQRPGPGGGDEDEVLSSRLLHRFAPTFAVGHGCSVEWEWQPPSPQALVDVDEATMTVSRVATTFVPSHEVLLTDSNASIDDEALLMSGLATAPEDELLTTLRRLASAYQSWIDERRAEVPRLSNERFRKRAGQHLDRCVTAHRRIVSGIRLLGRDSQAMEAFRLANEAMADQRARSSWIKNGRRGEIVLDGRWRPFQISFFLQCLDGMADSDHEDRKLVDLLWFPTGGGKTEAYLGLIAFSTFLRRLRHGTHGAGVTAIMRYTLRLLTLQQFERAASLICAMDRLRERDKARLGDEEISLGMWVGKAATPNVLHDAEEALDQLKSGRTVHEKNPVQLRSCPWCGIDIDAHDYTVDAAEVELRIRCRNSVCPFADGIPVHVVDQTIYRHHPTLVIATSDKFARLPWRSDVATLFNRDLPETPPPELVVQDELHLISGPLGSLAGLYETAIDEIADRPKVIASTATIRRAKQQARQLFDREVAQFPPPGLDARDSWFAVESPPAKKASRLYVGLLTPSTSQASLLVRAYAALLDQANLIDGDDATRDAYWTLIGYFNSLRLLAAAELQVRADVRERIGQLADDEREPRPIDAVEELTSRINSGDIPERLKELELAFPDKATLDVVLATNMISVGVDVDRLGLMAVMGQPQTTAEYIQSTSRVGRKHPGLVVTLFNAARSRDRSHYENFLSYHSALYRQVESTSVTPYSARARDRALHAVVVGLARLLIPELRNNEDARKIENYRHRLEEIKILILDRTERVAPEEVAATGDHIDAIVDSWCELARLNTKLVYEAPARKGGPKRDPHAALLRTFVDDDLAYAMPTLWSLRDVDAETRLDLEN